MSGEGSGICSEVGDKIVLMWKYFLIKCFQCHGLEVARHLDMNPLNIGKGEGRREGGQ